MSKISAQTEVQQSAAMGARFCGLSKISAQTEVQQSAAMGARFCGP